MAWKILVAQKHTGVLQLHLQNMPAILDSMTGLGTASN